MNLLITLLAFALAIGLLVTVHEYGHYWVARKAGVKVLTFSLGFGPVLLRRQVGETEWVLCAVPLGGYVRMLDEREAPVAEQELHRAFNRQPVGWRMAVVAAGPLANFLFAIVIFAAVLMVGVTDLQPIIGGVRAGSAADHAGLLPGDRIVRVAGEDIASWEQLRLALIDAASERQRIDLTVQSPAWARSELQLDAGQLTSEQIDGSVVQHLGIGWLPMLPVLAEVLPGGPAAQAGLQAGDRIVAYNRQPVQQWDTILAAIHDHPGRPLSLSIERAGGKKLELQLTPESVTENGKTFGRIRAKATVDEQALALRKQTLRLGPLQAVAGAVHKTGQMARLSLKLMWKMLLGEVSWRQISGPVAIADYAGQSLRLGMQPYLEFLCLISVSLGVMNLLPIPVLDGGHLVYYAAELAKGSPVSQRMQELGQRIGISLLAALMAFALFNDISRLLTG